MKIFVVGGAVRDVLMGLTPTDIDYVVEGSTPQQMLQHGFVQVGNSFPVFLHPDTGEEYALTRIERSTGNSYQDFECRTDNVTLREDLLRRDLTINSMAVSIAHWEQFVANPVNSPYLIDYFNGVKDLNNKNLRHVSEAFVEDPVRMLRIARFSSKYNFTIDSSTITLLKAMVNQQLFASLVPERVWNEIERVLQTTNAINFFDVIENIGANQQVFNQEFVINTNRDAFIYANTQHQSVITQLLAIDNNITILTQLKAPSKLIDDCKAVNDCYCVIAENLQATLPEHCDNHFWALNLCLCAKFLDIFRKPDRLNIVSELWDYEAHRNPDFKRFIIRYTFAIKALLNVKFADLTPEQQAESSKIQQYLFTARYEKVVQVLNELI